MSLANQINKDELNMNRNKKSKNALLFDFQKNVKKLFDEINKILSGKKGSEYKRRTTVVKVTVKNLLNCWEPIAA